MKALRYHALGGPEVLVWEEIPDPDVRAGDVLIKVAAAGVNFADLLRRQGQYTMTEPLPVTLGVEAAGTVVSVGSDVRDIQPGDRVLCRARGCQAELVAAPANGVNRIPDRLAFEEAAAIPVNFLTAYHMLRTLSPVRPGDAVLVQAAASGVGTAAVQLAKLWGARVLATASNGEKLGLAKRLGADAGINYTRQDFLAEVLARTDNRGVDRVLECVGGDVLTRSVKALAPGGVLMIYGRASGTLPPLSPEEFFPKNLRVFGVHIGMPPWTNEIHKAALEEIIRLTVGGKIRPVIDRTFPLQEAARAHEHLEQRKTMGKVLLIP